MDDNIPLKAKIAEMKKNGLTPKKIQIQLKKENYTISQQLIRLLQ